MTEPFARAPSPARAGAAGLALSGHVGQDEVAGLCDRVRDASATAGAGPIGCDCRAIVDPDAGTVEALARMALTARRLGRRLELQWSRADLVELLVLLGLDGLAVEVGREAEEREEPMRVEEERDPADPIA